MKASLSFSWVLQNTCTALSLLCLVNSQQIPDRTSLINYELEQLLVDTGGINGSSGLSNLLHERLIPIVRSCLQIRYHSLQQLCGPWRASEQQHQGIANLVSVDSSSLPYVFHPPQVLYFGGRKKSPAYAASSQRDVPVDAQLFSASHDLLSRKNSQTLLATLVAS